MQPNLNSPKKLIPFRDSDTGHYRYRKKFISKLGRQGVDVDGSGEEVSLYL
jgi:hypothetical protein